MEILKSEKFKIPTLYFISNRDEIGDLPIGVPFIYGDESIKSQIVRILEYEVLYQKAIATGLPFNFKKILKDEGYEGLEDFWYHETTYIDYKTSGEEYDKDYELTEDKGIKDNKSLFKQFVRDATAYVDIQKVKDLNVFPLWLDKIEDAVHTNIHNFAVYNSNMYNKKLEGMYGSIDLVSPNRNLIIIDISGSIPKAVSTTCLVLAKGLAETFYADLLITGTISTIYAYENLHELDVETIYDVNGMNNDQLYFKKLVTSEKRSYKTCIAFGDNHHPGMAWQSASDDISDEDGQKMCLWEINKLISFHTTSSYNIAGYARWFKPEYVEKITDWVKYLK